MKFIVYKDKAGEWRWHIVARNGRIVADSGEGYLTKGNAQASVKRLVKAIHAVPMNVEVLTGVDPAARPA